MVKVRLARRGTKKRPYYHVVVTDSESSRDGRFIEHIGTYDPSKEYGDAKVRLDRVDHWVSVGAQLSDRTADLVKAVRKQAAQASA